MHSFKFSNLCKIYIFIFLNIIIVQNMAFADVNGTHISKEIDNKLNSIVISLQENNPRKAFATSEELTKLAPNFQAGWVIKGDILNILAGNFPKQKDENIEQRNIGAYRIEIISRIKALTNPENEGSNLYYPHKIPASHKYWFYADLQKSRVYVLANNPNNPNKIEVVEDIYMSQGFNGAFKNKTGDNRTPIGVYTINSFIPKSRLEEFYGQGAYPISYPNNFDLSLGKTGSGIWIHGVPTNLFTRPPLATNGCIAISNEDILRLNKYITLGKTFLVTSNTSIFSQKNNSEDELQDLQKSFTQWQKDWESRDSNKYLANYAKDFKSDTGMDFQSWSNYKKQINSSKSYIKISVDDIAIIKYPEYDKVYWVSFNQNYQSDNLSQSSPKEQIWRKDNGRWQIIFEGGKSLGK